MAEETTASGREARDQVLERLQRAIPQLRERFGIRDLAVFGSTARGEARPDSDIDILVEFEDPATFDRYMDLRFHLEDVLGRRVDLVTKQGLRPQLRPLIEEEAVHVT